MKKNKLQKLFDELRRQRQAAIGNIYYNRVDGHFRIKTEHGWQKLQDHVEKTKNLCNPH